MRRLLLAALAASLPAVAADAAEFDHTHAAWTAVLTRHVQHGRVDYGALARDPAGLHAYLAPLEALDRATYDGFTPDQQKALWLNAYNAYTVKLILDHYPVDSIKKVGRFWQSPFKIEFIPLEPLRGSSKPLSLDVIEHDILRGEFPDARIHAAIVCASVSCPELRAEAFVAAELDRQLDTAMRTFLADEQRNRHDATSNILNLSAIFKWFRSDFERDAGSLEGFIARHVDQPLADRLASRRSPAIEFLDYDWSLNGR